MAVVIVLAAWITGGELGQAVLIAAVFFVLATAWGWRRWRERLRTEAEGKGGEARTGP